MKVICEHCKKEVEPRLIQFMRGHLIRCPECHKPIKKEKKNDPYKPKFVRPEPQLGQ